MRSYPLVSLIVVSYNSAAQLPTFFRALEQTRYQPYEVLVVDNASTDGSAALVAREHGRARLLANTENLGFGRACNQGARAAGGELLVFMNTDVAVTPDWLSILVRHLAEQPDAAIICPQTLDPDERSPTFRSSNVQTLKRSGVAATAAVPGCALMIRRAAWEALGGFDEQYFLYWEDTDLCWRAWLLGWRVLEDLEACVYHQRGGSAGGQRWDAERAKNGLRTYLKTMRWRRAAPFAALLAAKTLAKIALRRERGMIAAWAWNWRNLGETLARRREMARRRRIDPAELERLVAIHERRGRAARRSRGLVS